MRCARIAITLVASTAAIALLVPAVAPASTKAGKPSNFTITVSGQRLTAKQLTPQLDTYIPIRTGPITISVRWTTDLRGTNHRVIVTSSGGTDRKRCLSGTSCVLATKWSLKPTQETSWSVLIYNGTRLVSEKALCLVGKG
jgi:hypothetical protein